MRRHRFNRLFRCGVIVCWVLSLILYIGLEHYLQVPPRQFRNIVDNLSVDRISTISNVTVIPVIQPIEQLRVDTPKPPIWRKVSHRRRYSKLQSPSKSLHFKHEMISDTPEKSSTLEIKEPIITKLLDIQAKMTSYDTNHTLDIDWKTDLKIQSPFEYHWTSKFITLLRTRDPHSRFCTFIQEPASTPYKYFSESASTSYHTDSRFTLFDKETSLGQISSSIKVLFHAWNNFTAEHRFTSWIAHGALIGWYWNQQLLPWDVDIDVQTTLTDFQSILSPLNQTVWQDRYLLDINPHSFARQHQSNNVIDARFIDMHNGLYVDVTVLSLLQVAYVNSTLSDAFCSHATIEPLLVCKSPHIYRPSDIFPLRQTLFENIQVYRPNDVYSVLKQEYGIKSMTDTEYRQYTFVHQELKWIRKSTTEMVQRKYPVKPRLQ